MKENEAMIRMLYENMKQRGEYPNFGSPETHCDKCMFYGIACYPWSTVVGCLGGWKREEKRDG